MLRTLFQVISGHGEFVEGVAVHPMGDQRQQPFPINLLAKLRVVSAEETVDYPRVPMSVMDMVIRVMKR